MEFMHRFKLNDNKSEIAELNDEERANTWPIEKIAGIKQYAIWMPSHTQSAIQENEASAYSPLEEEVNERIYLL